MALVDIHTQLNRFYRRCVRITKDERRTLERARDACLDRLSRGMEELSDDRGRNFQTFESFIEQGSFAMGTLNQHPRGESDIDVAVIFRKEDLPPSALAARQRVKDALVIAGGNFVRPPEARTNAVTVWYANGSHVDFAVYREERGKLEHAGPEWSTLDPTIVTDWFVERVKALSPQYFEPNVKKHQLQRVVQWTKMFARSRRRWDLPGGMILSALLVETYRKDRDRDDVALYETLEATLSRLKRSLVVVNPVDPSHELTSKPTKLAQMKDLLVVLEDALEELSVIEAPTCSRKQALRAWGTFFNHTFWEQAAVDEPRQRA